MKRYTALALLVLATTLSSCELIGDIFQAGFYTAIIVIVIVMIIILWIIAKLRRRR